MVANGMDVAVVAYHMSDAYENQYSIARTNYYGISGIPDTYFDGVSNVVGGSSGTYNAYVNVYNTRIAENGYHSVDIYGQNTGSTYTIDLLLEEVDPYTSSDLRAHLFVTESNVGGYDYICRLMVPDENGTAIDFTSSNQVHLSLTFTLDPTWVSSECQIVAMIQDNTTQEVMQTDKVDLDQLQPMNATAGFMCSDTSTCEGSSVNFTDMSLGIITSYEWHFEGGDPATSSDPNPTVTYNTEGVYDVTQIVSDGSTSDTLELEDYVEVKTIPAQADMPSGSSNPCQNSSPQYTTNPVTYADNYTWSLEPSDAGTISGNGTTATLNLNQTFTGDIGIKVRAENECGDGAWSGVMNATVQSNPEIFNLTAENNGAYCEGTSGAEVYLDGSESGIDYELFMDEVSTGIVITGTGDVLSFGVFSEDGLYTAMGSNTYCDMDMAGSAWVHMINAPGTPAAPTGSTAECNDNDSTVYTTTGASDADVYTWALSPEEAGTIEGSTESAVVDWNDSYSGLAYISVMGSNECGDGPVSDELEVNVYPVPDPVVSGDDLVCEYWQGIIYTTPETTGSTYTWEIEGGTIVSGAGTHEVSVDWGAAGDGWLRVTEVSSDACENTSVDFPVTIDDCTNINEFSAENVSIYPNPARDELYVEFDRQLSEEFTVRIMDLTGKTIAHFTENANNGLIKINISNLQKGLYSIELSNEESGKITQRLIKY